jgi:hypothetical protein
VTDAEDKQGQSEDDLNDEIKVRGGQSECDDLGQGVGKSANKPGKCTFSNCFFKLNFAYEFNHSQ